VENASFPEVVPVSAPPEFMKVLACSPRTAPVRAAPTIASARRTLTRTVGIRNDINDGDRHPLPKGYA